MKRNFYGGDFVPKMKCYKLSPQMVPKRSLPKRMKLLLSNQPKKKKKNDWKIIGTNLDKDDVESPLVAETDESSEQKLGEAWFSIIGNELSWA